MAKNHHHHHHHHHLFVINMFKDARIQYKTFQRQEQPG